MANSPGWGGPPKGAHPAVPGHKLTDEDRAKGRRVQQGLEERSKKALAKIDRLERLKDFLYEIATRAPAAEATPIQLQAINAYFDRVEGKPTQKVINENIEVKVVREELNGGAERNKAPEPSSGPTQGETGTWEV